MDELCERREVQRHLADASLAEEQDRSNNEELHQPVRRLPLTPHERKRHRGPPVTGNEVQETPSVVVPIARDHHDRVTLVLPAQGVQRHREPALGPATAPVARDAFELGRRRLVDRGHVAQLCPIAGLLEPCDGLAHFANRPSFE